MILKLCLGIGIIFCSCQIGILLSKRYVLRLEELEEFKNDFQIIENKIRYTYETLEEIFNEIAEISSFAIGKFFKNVAYNLKKEGTEKAWNNEINKIDSISLTKEDKTALKEFSTLLGKTNKEGQINQIKYVLERLELQIEKAKNEREKNETIYKKLGLILGIGLVIIIY